MIKRWVILLSLVIMLTCDKIGDCSMQIITPNDYITVQLDCSRNQIKVSILFSPVGIQNRFSAMPKNHVLYYRQYYTN